MFVSIKKKFIFAMLSWKQSFYLKRTNTYWRFGAVACEGHRFFLVCIAWLHFNGYKSHGLTVKSVQSKTMVSAANGIWGKSSANVWSDIQKFDIRLMNLGEVARQYKARFFRLSRHDLMTMGYCPVHMSGKRMR